MTIAKLPAELREDIIVMQITLANGKSETKAIMISLMDDGRFFATFDNYKITDKDDFVQREDSEAIPRDILYTQGDSKTLSENENTAKSVARAYYEDTVFEVTDMQFINETDTEAVFSVRVSNEGIIQSPNRIINLQLQNGIWIVTNEGY